MEEIDGRKSFVFSWNKKHRVIHEEALLHYFDPSKKGQKFEYQPSQTPQSSFTELDKVAVEEDRAQQISSLVSSIEIGKEVRERAGARPKKFWKFNMLRSPQGKMHHIFPLTRDLKGPLQFTISILLYQMNSHEGQTDHPSRRIIRL